MMKIHHLHTEIDGFRETHVVAIDIEVIGTLSVFHSAGKTAMIRGLYVDPEYRRKGVATALIAYAIELAAEGHDRLCIEVLPENRAAAKLYGAIGMTLSFETEEVSIYTHHYPHDPS
jgi:GNAT superfamily N-acetyltransferase